MLRRLSRVLGLCCLTACGTDPEDFGRCAGGLALSVSGDAAPEFGWTPADCPINDLVVEQASVIHWSLASRDPANVILPPVRYGEPARPETIGGGEGARLIPGNRYLVRLFRIADDGLVGVAGEVQFLYQPVP
jgi:hypothetical protein